MKDFKYKSKFKSSIAKVSTANSDQKLALASLDDLKKLTPAGIDLSKNLDLTCILLNTCVPGKMNLNGDAITNETGLEIAKLLQYKYIDQEHENNKLVGVICNYGFSTWPDNQVLSSDEVSKLDAPYNIAVAGLIYNSVVPDGYIDYLYNTTDVASKDYNGLSASWELFFNDYDICVSPTLDIKDGKTYSDANDKLKLESMLLAHGGNGKDIKNNNVFRVIKGEYVIPAGIGLVSQPAGQVLGLVIANEESENPVAPVNDQNDSSIKDLKTETAEINNKDMKKAIKKFVKALTNEVLEKIAEEQGTKLPETTELPIVTAAIIPVIENSTSQPIIKDVIDNSNINIPNNMLISKIEDITDESLKTATASVVKTVISDEIKKISDDWSAKMKAKEDESKSFAEAKAKAEKDILDLSAKLTLLQTEIDKQASLAKAAKSESDFNTRMSYFDDTYNLTDNIRKTIASDLKDLTDEAFASYSAKMEILLAEKNKKLVLSTASVVIPEVPTVTAAVAAAPTVVTTAALPSAPAPTESLTDKYKKAFAPTNENFAFNTSRLEK